MDEQKKYKKLAIIGFALSIILVIVIITLVIVFNNAEDEEDVFAETKLDKETSVNMENNPYYTEIPQDEPFDDVLLHEQEYFTKVETAESTIEELEIKEKMTLVEGEVIIEYITEENVDVVSIVKDVFADYTIINSSNLSCDNGSIKGTMIIETEDGDEYVVDFTENTVTKE